MASHQAAASLFLAPSQKKPAIVIGRKSARNWIELKSIAGRSIGCAQRLPAGRRTRDAACVT
ncbi:MAG TPA: hypothetical protein PKB14_10180 [Rubrivivax sp.]|nr:hypothetical protein [Rubrivivax sp.]